MDKDNVFIRESMPRHEDRIIRSVYTPKEVIKNIKNHFELMYDYHKLTYGEQALLMDFCNLLIRWYVENE